MIDEALLRRVVGNRQIMTDQLNHLAQLSEQPHVTLQVLPYDVGAHPGMYGKFAILEFHEAMDASVVYLEGVTSDLYLEKANDVQSYAVMYEHLRAKALSAEQSREFIHKVAESCSS